MLFIQLYPVFLPFPFHTYVCTVIVLPLIVLHVYCALRLVPCGDIRVLSIALLILNYLIYIFPFYFIFFILFCTMYAYYFH